MKFATVIGAALGAALIGAPVQAATLESTRIKGWLAGAYTDDASGDFTRCTMSADFKSGVTLLFSIDKGYRWLLALSSKNFDLEDGASRRIVLTIDRGRAVTTSARVVSSEILGVDLEDSSALFNQFRTGRLLNVEVDGERYQFRLDGTSAGLTWLLDCVRRHQTRLAQPRGRQEDDDGGGSAKSFARGSGDADDDDAPPRRARPDRGGDDDEPRGRRLRPAPPETEDEPAEPLIEARRDPAPPAPPAADTPAPDRPEVEARTEEPAPAPPDTPGAQPKLPGADFLSKLLGGARPPAPDQPPAQDRPRIEARRDTPAPPSADTPPKPPAAPGAPEEVTTFLSNLLTSAGLTGFRLLPAADLPPELQRFPVAWSTPDGIVGIAGIDSDARTARLVSNKMLTDAAAACNGQFASGTVPSVGGSDLVQVFTGCDDGTAPLAGRYTIIPRKGGGHFVVGVFSTGSSTPSERMRQVDGTVRDAAIRLVARR